MIAFLRGMVPPVDNKQAAQSKRLASPQRLVRKQYADFADALRTLGAKLEYVPAVGDLESSLSIEDTAVMLPDLTLIARPGASAPSVDIETITQTLAQHRPLQSIAEPGCLVGGDVLRIGRTVFVAESPNTNADGIAQLREIVISFGYNVRTITYRDCPRLKAACSFVPPRFLVVNPAWVDVSTLGNLVVIPVDDKEPFAANTLTLGRTTLVSSSCPTTEKRLREAGISTQRVEISEFEKLGVGVSSLCLPMESRVVPTPVNDPAFRSIQVGGVPAPAGYCSQAVVHGDLVFVSPQPPFDPAAKNAPRLSFEEQAERAIHNLSVVLTVSGSSLGRVVRSTIHVADPKFLSAFETIYGKNFGEHRPARAVIVNTALPAGVLIEIEAVAAVMTEMVL